MKKRWLFVPAVAGLVVTAITTGAVMVQGPDEANDKAGQDSAGPVSINLDHSRLEEFRARFGDRWDRGEVSYRLADRKQGERLTGDNLEDLRDRWRDRYHFGDREFNRGNLHFSDRDMDQRLEGLKERMIDRSGNVSTERLQDFKERLKEWLTDRAR